ncbi:MAG: peptide ABC transporter ATP-binding protein [Nitrospirae bacterium RIFCSPHIGHO2_01_FULL_66_17]|nr:MAG: peptide ABC transporter ATP-binding protein [Nitrospirae bacterium RIFCSPHIGHO2_01_FULL_66_17]
MPDPLLSIADLTVEFPTDHGPARAVDRVSLAVTRGEVLGVVGESGCGKSMTALSVLRLVPPPGRITSGEIRFVGQDLLSLPLRALQALRGRKIAMIFQEPMTALNPVLTVGEQIAEMLRLHLRVSRSEAKTRAIELLRLVRIPSPEKRWSEYPHQLSGGMRQRVMIAMAVSCDPDLVFADEPTTALDVTVQAQILDLLADLRERLGMAMVLISHNLGVIAQVAHHVAVMYAGRIVEHTTTTRLFSDPQHPYTRGLLGSLPSLDGRGRRGRLIAIPGTVPSLGVSLHGCAFAPRCPLAIDVCRREDPPLETKRPGHLARCWVVGSS